MSVALLPMVVHARDMSLSEDSHSFYPGTHSLVSPLASIKNFDRLSQAVYNATTEEVRLNGIQVIRAFVNECPEDPYSVDLLEVVFEYFPLWYDKSAMPLLHKIALIQDHPKVYDALGFMLWKGNRDEQKFSARQLLSLANKSNHPSQFDAARELLSHSSPFYDSPFIPILMPLFKAVAKDTKHPKQGEAVLNMWQYSEDQDDVSFARAELYKMLDDQNYLTMAEAAIALFNKGNKMDRTFVRPILYNIAHGSNSLKKRDVANALRNGTKKDQATALFALRVLMKTPNYPEEFLVSSDLLHFGNEKDKNEARQNLYEIGNEIEGSHAYHALSCLSHSNVIEDKEFAWPLIRRIAFHPQHHDAFYAMQTLFYRYDNEEDKNLVRPLLHAVSLDPHNTHAIRAAQTLFSGGNEEDKALVRPILYAAAQDPDDLNAPSAVNALWFSVHEEDKALARQYLYAVVEKNPSAFRALQSLLQGNEEDKEFARPRLKALIEIPNSSKASYLIESFKYSSRSEDKTYFQIISRTIAQDLENPNAFNAALSLWHSDNKEDKALVRPTLYAIAQDYEDVNMSGAAICLWYGNEEDKNIARKGLYAMTHNLDDPELFKAMGMLYESSNERDHEVADEALFGVIREGGLKTVEDWKATVTESVKIKIDAGKQKAEKRMEVRK